METIIERRPAVVEVRWLHDLQRAFEQAERENKFVLLDFFSPT
jgi:hypothetical protein